MANSYIKVFYDFLETTSRLTDAERGRLVEAMIIYARDGIETEAMIGNEQFLFPVFKAQIDRDKAAYSDISEKRKAAGSRGGKAKVANASKSYQEKEQEKEEEKEKEQELLVNNAREDGITTQTREYIRTYVSEMPKSGWDTVTKLVFDGMDEVVIRFAIDRACSHGCSKWCYIEKILLDWAKAGVKTVAHAKAEIAKFEDRKRVAYADNKNASALNYQQHAYSESDFGEDFYYNPERDFLPR